MKKVWILLLLLVNLGAKELGVLPGVINPVHMKVWQGKLFISERSTVWVFDLADFSQRAQFGREGGGPGEFILGHGATAIVMDVDARHIVVNSSVRVAFFDHSGRFEKQVNVGPMMHMVPFGEGFISPAMIKGERDVANKWIALFDANGQRKRAIFNTGVQMGMGVNMPIPAHFYGMRVTGDRALVATGRTQPEWTAFDVHGEKLSEIRLKVEPIPLTAGFKEEVKLFYQKDIRYKNFWDYIQKHMVFPDEFPPVRDMLVDQGRVYLLRYGDVAKGKYPWVSVDMEGKDLIRLDLRAEELSVLELAPYDIHQGIYYHLSSDDQGEWSLWGEDLQQMRSVR